MKHMYYRGYSCILKCHTLGHIVSLECICMWDLRGYRRHIRMFEGQLMLNTCLINIHRSLDINYHYL